MKLVNSAQDRFVFHLSRREKDLLLTVTRLYPRITSPRQPLSKKGDLPECEASQRLLDEALAEHRAEAQKQAQTLLADPSRLGQHETGWRLSLSRPDLEMLLQVLNEIRVGSWVLLGSPEDHHHPALNAETAPHLWAMELAGGFEMALLQAMGG